MSIGPCVAAWLFLTSGCLCAQGISPNTNLTAREEQIIAAAKAGAAPRFNGACIVGIRPGTPLVYGQSITDGCIDWAETRTLLAELAEAVRARRGK